MQKGNLEDNENENSKHVHKKLIANSPLNTVVSVQNQSARKSLIKTLNKKINSAIVVIGDNNLTDLDADN